MKKLIFILAIAAIVASCKSTDEPKVFKIDPLATVNIKPKAGAWKSPLQKVKSTSEYLSALDIVKQTTIMNLTDGDGFWVDRIFFNSQKDTVSAIPKLLMFATDIIDGRLIPAFIDANNVIFCHLENPIDFRSKRDTIGYIPNAVLRAAAIEIRVAYDAKDIVKVNKLFEDAFSFVPTSGADYKALKLSGNQ